MDALPETIVTPETYAAYVEEAESYRADHLRDLERERDKARRDQKFGMAIGAIGVAVAGIVCLRSHPEGWIMS